MKISELNNLPVPYHYTFDILDSSKLTTFMDCPRRYFYRYVLGWTFKGANIHLEFGEGWHRAMEYIRLNGYTDKVAAEAADVLEEYFRRSFSEATDLDNAPKNPGNARLALHEYVNFYRDADAEVETLFTEISGVIPVDEDRVIYIRLDSVNYKPGMGIFFFDYKTGSRYTSAWVSQWQTSLQMNTYNHALRMIFPNDRVYGGVIDGAFFYKSPATDLKSDPSLSGKFRPQRVPLKITDDMINSYLFDINHWARMLEWEFVRLEECKKEDQTLKAFPKNTNACVAFGRLCPFHGFCTSRANPLRISDSRPPDMQEDRWDPTKRDNIKHIFDGKELKNATTND